MTDRISSFLVVLDHDIRDDDIEHTLKAVSMIKNVSHIEVNIAEPWEQQVGAERERDRLRKILREALSNL